MKTLIRSLICAFGSENNIIIQSYYIILWINLLWIVYTRRDVTRHFFFCFKLFFRLYFSGDSALGWRDFFETFYAQWRDLPYAYILCKFFLFIYLKHFLKKKLTYSVRQEVYWRIKIFILTFEHFSRTKSSSA